MVLFYERDKKYYVALVVLLVILLLFSALAYAELIDYSNNRRAYAKAISQLGLFEESSDDLRKRSVASILVLFRTQNGIPDFGDYTPDTLISGPHGCFTAAYKDENTAIAAVQYLRSLSDVIYAELDGEVFACDGETDYSEDESEITYMFHSYGASEMGFGKAASWCRKVGDGAVTVAVIDSGVFRHTILTDRIRNSGFDYVDGDDDSTDDTFGHGTHVAGIVVDCTPDLPIYIFPIRVLNASGKGSIANTTSAIFEAAEVGCGVINLSLVSDKHSEALEDANKFALNHGSAVVISAGNNGNNTADYCPVHLEDPGFIVVGACSGSLDTPVQTSYSNYGPSVDVYAFGTSIRSCSLNDGYVSRTGTSQAAPHISALCAILKRLFPSIGCAQIELRVKALSDSGEINVPNAALLKPQTMGISAQEIYLPVGTQIRLLRTALPERTFIDISWSCANESVASVDESDVLMCLSEGTTILSGIGPANVRITATVNVFDENSVYHIPSDVISIEEEAFEGTAMQAVLLPVNIQVLNMNAFAQSNIKTIFYNGSNMFFDIQNRENSEICVVTAKESNLWEKLEREGIDYLISCGE